MNAINSTMDILSGFSYLQQFWGLQTIVIGGHTLYLVARGHYWDKSFGDRSPDEEFGLLQFRKRIAQYYFVAILWTGWIGVNVFSVYCLGSQPGGWFNHLVDTAASPRTIGTDSTCVQLAVLMFSVHLLRRFYESFSVSIFSRRQYLGPLGVLLNFAYYIAAGLSLVAEAPVFEGQSACVSLSSLSWRHPVALVLFIWASRVHHDSHQVLARLRKNRAGHVVTTSYKMPKGGWFDKVSCPHYFAEIVIYGSIGMVLGMHSTTWWWMTAHVFTNQYFLGYSTHTWYQKKFDNYPTDRKIMIPYLL